MRSMSKAIGSVLWLELLAVTLQAASVAAAPFAYVTNSFDNTVSVLDTATNTVVATVPVGPIPFGVAITPDGAHAYVANQGSDTVSVLATASNTVWLPSPWEPSPRGWLSPRMGPTPM